MTSQQRPVVKPGHRLIGAYNNFWYAVDDTGYEYVVGCGSRPLDGGGRMITETTADGNVKQWQVDNEGHHHPMQAPEAMAEAAIPAGLRAVEWGGVPRGRVGATAESDCEDWGKNVGTAAQRSWLWLHGPRGTGKSSIAALVVRDAIPRGIGCMLVDWGELLRRIKATYNDKEAANPIDGAIAVDLLVLDDVGKDQPTEHAAQVLFEIVNGREREGRPTMGTSNYSVKDACLRYGKDKGLALVDRIGVYSEVALGGGSNRQGDR